MKSCVITAHPDDEILWFSSILFRENPDVICVTCGRDNNDHIYRKESFKKTMNILDIKNYEILCFPDTNKRLDLSKLEKSLNSFRKEEYDKVYTHGPFGETHNNIHHQDVSYIVNKVFKNVYSIAWNLYPDISNFLSKEEFTLKKYLFGTIYSEEYKLLCDSFEISPVENFINLSRESTEIFYYGIANFGDNHELLGKKYKDFWGFEYSPYEIERHESILSLVKMLEPKNIIEYGACEGLLTKKLSSYFPIECTEKAPTYRQRLIEKGFNVVDNPNSSNYSLSIVAAFLEYLDRPEEFLNQIKSKNLLVDVILNSNLDLKLEGILNNYREIDNVIVNSRWEKMYNGNKKEKMEVYKLGSHIHLFEKK